MSAHVTHLVTGEGRWARSYCGRFCPYNGTPSLETFRTYWLNNPSHVCASCAAKAKALKII